MTEQPTQTQITPDDKQRYLKITISGEAASGKTTLMQIIKECLDRDFTFRMLFNKAIIYTEETIEKLPTLEELQAKQEASKEESIKDKVTEESAVSTEGNASISED